MKRIEDLIPIEELTQDDVTKAESADLLTYRLKFCQVFKKRERANRPTDMMLPGYAFVTAEMKDRGLVWKSQEIDLELFRARIAVGLKLRIPDEDNELEEEEVIEDAPDIEKEAVGVSIISKSDDDERIVFGVVYEPDEEDTQGDYATAEEIRKAAYSFMENGQTYHVMHKGAEVPVCVLESYLAPVEFQMGEETVKKGTWLLGSRIPEGEMWTDIKSGELAGYSMGGTGDRV